MYFYCAKPEHFQKNCRRFWKEKGGVNNVDPKKNLDQKAYVLLLCEAGALSKEFVKMGNE